MISLAKKACKVEGALDPQDLALHAPRDITTDLMMTLTTPSQPSPSETQKRCSGSSLVEILHSLISLLLSPSSQWGRVLTGGGVRADKEVLASKEPRNKITTPSPVTFSLLSGHCSGLPCSLHSQGLKASRVGVALPHFHHTPSALLVVLV